MNSPADSRIANETLHLLSAHYQAVASTPDFPGLSGFERWLRLHERVAQMPGAIDPRELAELETLDVALKSQILDWLQRRRELASASR